MRTNTQSQRWFALASAVAAWTCGSAVVGSSPLGRLPTPAAPHSALLTRNSAAFGRAITARETIVLNGRALVDAFDSALGAYDPVTNRFAAGDIAAASTAARAISVGAAKVFGTAKTGPGGTLKVTSGAVGSINWCYNHSGVEPGWTTNNFLLSFSTNALPSGVPFLALGVTSVCGSNITYLTIDGSAGIYTALNFTSHDMTEPLIVLGRCALYVTGDFTLHGSGYVYIAPGASLDLYVGGQASIAGQGVLNASGRAANFRFVGLAGNRSIRFDGNAAFVGTINAPQADIVLNGHAEGFGEILCRSYTANGSASFHHDISLLGDPDLRVAVWITDIQGSKYLAMKFRTRNSSAALGLQYRPEVSGDRQTWFSDSGHVLIWDVTPAPEEGSNWVTVRDTIPITVPAPRFIRLRVLQNSLQWTSEVWIGADSLVRGHDGSGSKLSLFSFRMVNPTEYAGNVTSLGKRTLTDTNAGWADDQFNGTNGSFYLEFTNGWTVDIVGTSGSARTLMLADDLGPAISIGDPFRIRKHFTVGSVFGPNNVVGLKPGLKPASADNILLQIPETQQLMTIFYSAEPAYAGWYRADYSSAANQVIYPEEGIMVQRKAPGDLNVYLLGLVKSSPTIAPVQPGYNLLGTLKSLANLKLTDLNLYTGNPATGIAGALTPARADNLLMIEPTGATTIFFYYKDSQGNQGWLDAAYGPAGDRLINAGSAFFINRKTPNGPFNWTIPAE